MTQLQHVMVNVNIEGTIRCLGVHRRNKLAPHSSTLAWKIPWTEEPGGLQSMGSLRVRHDWVTSLSLFTFMHWRGTGNPLQCSFLENPRDRGAWWATIYGVAQSRTRLKRLSSSSSSKGIMNDFLEEITLVLSHNEWVGINQVYCLQIRCISTNCIWKAIITGITHLILWSMVKKNQELNK